MERPLTTMKNTITPPETAPLPRAPRRRTRRGVTLIELLVAALMVGVLMAIALPLYLASARAASVQAVRTNLRAVGQAARSHYLKHGQYPASIDDIVGSGKDIERIEGPRGVTYDVTYTGSGGAPSDGEGGSGNGNGRGADNPGNGEGTGAPGNGKGQGNPGGPHDNGGGDPEAAASVYVVRATENGADAFGPVGTADTATFNPIDGNYSGL